jgi:vancomycin resistance protein VanW
MILKKIIPKSIRLWIKQTKRNALDHLQGHARYFVKPIKHTHDTYIYGVHTTQEIKQGPFFDNKLHNITFGVEILRGLALEPHQIFSFWQLVGKPSKENGFKEGRNLIDGLVKSDYGGGLCQLSGIIYYTALKAQLAILERHNHTVDIYKEEDRFCPLGADATVVYGYKDLRIRNNTPHKLILDFSIEKNHLTCSLKSEQPIQAYDIFFEKDYQEKKVAVTTKTRVLQNDIVLNISTYKLP